MKNLYGGKIVEKDIIENLYSLELVDWFKNEITKITDQSFGNYILYYVLFEKKWVSVESLISVGFPAFRNKIVYALNTLMEIFNSEECTKYIEDSIIAAWDNAPMEQDMEYLESFYQVNLDKALSIIKNHIDQDVNVDFDLHSFDINSKKNYHNIKTKVIEILGGYKYTENFEDAVDLLMLYFEKRPDLIMDFYFVLSERLLYDKYSYRDKYNHEMRLLDRVWCYTEEGKNYNNSILYLQIAEYALKTEISFTEEIRNSRSVNFVSAATPLTLRERKFAVLMDRFKADHTIFPEPCPGLVEIVEHGQLDDHDVVMRTLHQYFDQYDLSTIDAVVLGCTHFVFYRDYFRELLPDTAEIIDGNEGTVRHLGVVLESLGKLAPEDTEGDIKLANSDTSVRIAQLAQSLLNR